MTKEQAVQSAGARLDRLNETMRRLLIAAVAIASMLAVLTALALYSALEYWRLKSAVSEAQSKLSQSLKSMPKRPTPGIE